MRARRAREGVTSYNTMTYNALTTRARQGIPLRAPVPHTLRVGQRAQGTDVDEGRLVIFDVIGDPKATPRTKSTVRGKGKKQHASVYTPTTAHAWKHDVRAAAIDAIGAWVLIAPRVPVELYLCFRFARPKSHYRTGKFAELLKDSAPTRRHTQVPDKDNLEKAVMDALGKFDGMPPLIWCDDCQVDDGAVRKRWADPGEDPGCSVTIMEIIE